MSQKNALKTVTDNFKAIIESIDKEFGKDYSSKNPLLVQFLLSRVQDEEYRQMDLKARGQL